MYRCLWVCLFSTLAGCGGAPFDVVPVSGVVTLDGNPLPDARISFEPRRVGDELNAGPGSYGKTDAEGRYRLETLDGVAGAVVATHDVRISTFRAQADPASDEPKVITAERVPARYFESGTLTCTVTVSGNDNADFHLTTP